MPPLLPLLPLLPLPPRDWLPWLGLLPAPGCRAPVLDWLWLDGLDEVPVVVRLDEPDEPLVVVRDPLSRLTLTLEPPERLCTVVRELRSPPPTITPCRRFFVMSTELLSGSDATKRARFFDTNFLFLNFFLMTVRLDGSSARPTVWRERLWIVTLSRPRSRTPKRVSERPRMLVWLPPCSLRADVLLPDWPLVSLPRIEELDPLFWPAFWLSWLLWLP
jgi:hypothetical protein